ncbi:MAG: hypothetical protein IKI42_10215 [Clostridia bacterium]|nr:hypothetical protein [Clostridia bacterium]
MKKAIRIFSSILALVIMLSMFISFMGCTSSKMIGTWRFENEEIDMILTFQHGGKGYIVDARDEQVKIKITWKCSDDRVSIYSTEKENAIIEFKIESITSRKMIAIPIEGGEYNYDNSQVLIKTKR